MLTEQGLTHWRKYVVAFIMMAVAAGCTAFSAYLIGDVINQAYVNHNLPGIITLGFVTAALFAAKGVATYGHSVMLSRIGNRIVADNQRAVFAKLLNEGLSFFSDRHSTEFIARLSTGAASATQVINLLITSVGRDLLSLIGLVIVMVVQDPLMSFFSFVVAPPAFFILRKLIRRIYTIARTQFHGSTRIIETLQETLQGIRIVKAFTLEDIMRERFDRNVAAVEHEANKMARVSNRASPLMETLGGCAIAIAITYGGYRVIETGATPGQFFSFITAFLLAYEPAKRLARLNIELNSALVGVRILFEIIDSPPSEPSDDNKPGLQIKIGSPGIQRRVLRISHRRVSPARHVVRGRAGQDDRAGRTFRRRQIDRVQSDCCDFTKPSAAISSSMSRILRKRRAVRCVSTSRMSDRTCSCSAARSARTLSSENLAPARMKSLPPPRPHMRTISSCRSREDMKRRLASTACSCPAGSASASRLRARLSRMRRSFCSMKPPPRWIPNPNCRCARPWSISVKARTTLAIAHRLHTVSHADRIYVVEDGRAVESGRHDELLRKGGRYASFYRLQLKEQEARGPVAVVATS